MNAGCAGKTVRSLQKACRTWAPYRCVHDKALHKYTFTCTSWPLISDLENLFSNGHLTCWLLVPGFTEIFLNEWREIPSRRICINGRPNGRPENRSLSAQAKNGVLVIVAVSGDHCEEGACKNGARCISQLNGVVCNCDMTSFTGPTCADGSLFCPVVYTVVIAI